MYVLLIFGFHSFVGFVCYVFFVDKTLTFITHFQLSVSLKTLGNEVAFWRKIGLDEQMESLSKLNPLQFLENLSNTKVRMQLYVCNFWFTSTTRADLRAQTFQTNFHVKFTELNEKNVGKITRKQGEKKKYILLFFFNTVYYAK